MIRGLWQRLTGKRPAVAGKGRAVQFPRQQRFASPVVETTDQIIRASYDAATTTDHNSRHWAASDSLSADAANSKGLRDVLRSRARYEAQENNSVAKGICLTLSNDLVGTGPRLQVLTGSSGNNAKIEAAFAAWAKRINLAAKLRTMRLAKAVDGECFGQLISNPRLPDVQLDLFLLEAEQVTDDYEMPGANRVDGIRFDSAGNPLVYKVLKQHPGSNWFTSTAADDVAAENMIHLFRCDRPGQHRGIPEITPALPLFAQLRRFTLATIAAAETAADFAGVMFTDAPAIADPDDVDAMQAIELEMRAMLTLPRGWKMAQMRAEHPATTYDMFRNAIINEIARCLNMPFNIAAGNSAGYNFASSRMDHQLYFRSIEVERKEWEIACLDRLLSAWFDEASLIGGLLPGNMGAMPNGLPHVWQWDGWVHVDPAKEATATDKALRNGTTSHAYEANRQGRDYEVIEQQNAAAYGLTVQEYRDRLRDTVLGSESGALDEQEQEEPAEAA